MIDALLLADIVVSEPFHCMCVRGRAATAVRSGPCAARADAESELLGAATVKDGKESAGPKEEHRRFFCAWTMQPSEIECCGPNVANRRLGVNDDKEVVPGEATAVHRRT